MYYYYNKFSQIGTFIISQNIKNPGKWNLIIDDKLIGVYRNPELAANAVYLKKTGYKLWDLLDPNPDNPYNLSKWTKVED